MPAMVSEDSQGALGKQEIIPNRQAGMNTKNKIVKLTCIGNYPKKNRVIKDALKSIRFCYTNNLICSSYRPFILFVMPRFRYATGFLTSFGD
jgi:hypothetical protein